ncbi:MAG TPA: ferritin-like domain-containing protein [Solirubrobacteraceae bacterium]|nr:ferritin-like domain-containing protein [Solirubrobacteraceae bacterium]
MTPQVTRGRFLSLSGAGLAAAAGLGALAPAVLAAAPASDLGALSSGDLAYARLLICYELLEIDFFTNAIRSRHLRGTALREARAALANEREHYAYLAGAITDAGATPLSAADVDFSYPRTTFYGGREVKRFALGLEQLTLASYLGAGGAIADGALAAALAQIAANEAQHGCAFALIAGHALLDEAFPPSVTIEEASNALGAYTS